MSENDIRPGTEVTFADKTRKIYPASLRQLRGLTKLLKELDLEKDVDDETVDKMVEVAGVILSNVDSEIAEDSEALQDIIDIKSFNEMVAAAMGADPNALGGMIQGQ